MRKVWTQSMIQELKEAYPDGNLDEIAKRLGVTRTSVKSMAHKLKLKRSVNIKHVWTEDEDRLLRELYAETDTREICKLLGIGYRSVYQHALIIGCRKSHEYKSCTCNPGGRNGMGTRFQKGHVPNNKGKKEWQFRSKEASERCRATQFRKGNKPHNIRPVGYASVHKDGYVFIKTADKMVPKHIYVWQQHHGEIPEGYIVMFVDGDKTNCDISNLCLKSRQEAMAIMRDSITPERRIQITKKIQDKRNETIRKDKMRIRWGLEPRTKLVKKWHAPGK